MKKKIFSVALTMIILLTSLPVSVSGWEKIATQKYSNIKSFWKA